MATRRGKLQRSLSEGRPSRCAPPPHRREPLHEAATERARELLETAYAHRLTLDGIAKAAGMSKYHLARRFRASFGVTVHQYLLLVRVHRAMERLRRGEPPVQVATEVGFADQPHMTRVFRKLVGLTPARYAARERLHSRADEDQVTQGR